MKEQKMNEVILTTSAFNVTLTYPIINKIKRTISKKTTVVEEQIDAAIVLSPRGFEKISKEEQNLTHRLYYILCLDSSEGLARKKEEEIDQFLHLCGEKIREEFLNNLDLTELRELNRKIEHTFLHLLDRSGSLVHSEIKTIKNTLFWLQVMERKILFWPVPEKLSSLFISHETPPPRKSRQRERVKNKKEGWHKKSHVFFSDKAA